MKKVLFTVIIFMLMTGFVSAKEPEYEVTIHVVYNSIPVSEIGDLVRDQLSKHKDACKVEVKIKKPDMSDTILIYDAGTTTTTTWTVND